MVIKNFYAFHVNLAKQSLAKYCNHKIVACESR